MFVVRTGKVVSESFFDHTLGNDEAGYTFVASSGKPMFSVYPNVTCRIPDSQQEGTYAMTYVDPSNRFMYFGCCREATPPGKM